MPGSPDLIAVADNHAARPGDQGRKIGPCDRRMPLDRSRDRIVKPPEGGRTPIASRHEHHQVSLVAPLPCLADVERAAAEPQGHPDSTSLSRQSALS